MKTKEIPLTTSDKLIQVSVAFSNVKKQALASMPIIPWLAEKMQRRLDRRRLERF